MDGAARRSRRWAVAICLWLLVVPAALLAVRVLLPSDGVGTVPPGQGATGADLTVQTVHDVSGLQGGDVVLAVNGVPAEHVLTHPRARSVRAGDTLVYTVRRDGTVSDVPVRLRSHFDLRAPLSDQQPDAGLVSVAMLALAVWLLRRRPDERAVHAFLLFASGWASSALAGWAWPSVVDFWARPWMVTWADLSLAGYLVSGLATLLFAASFPSAGARSARRPWTAVTLAPVLLCVGFAGWEALHGTRSGDFATLNGFAELAWQACTLATLVVMGVRWYRLRTDTEASRRFQVVALGLVVTLAVALAGRWLEVPVGTFGFGLVLLVFPASVAVALTRRGLYELDLTLSRALVAFGSAVVLLVSYLAITAATVAVTRSDGPWVALPAAGFVAVAFAPVRAWLQRLVSARMFGAADDPQLVLHRLGVRLEASDDPESLLAATVDTAAETLRLPYVAVELTADDGRHVVHEQGRRTEHLEHFDITVGQQVVGRLIVAAHRDSRALSPLDRRILSDLARHSGVAARAVALLTDLRAAQQRLLVAREDERHRIHRDLHDGIGPTLVGLTLQLEVATELAGVGDLQGLLGRLHAEAARTTDDVRRMVRDLRPGELEELGLPAAVAAAAARLRSPHAPHFDLETPLSLPVLDVEVEDAAYKICLEAMANVIRHSGARHCTVRLAHRDHRLEIDVSDDGCGLGPQGDGGSPLGTGLRSMEARAASVGGRLSISPCDSGGTRVAALLPTRVPAGSGPAAPRKGTGPCGSSAP